MTRKFTSVAAYIAAAPKEKQATLAELPKTIRSAAPKATEEYRYDMVGYMQHGKSVAQLRRSLQRAASSAGRE